MTNLKSQEAINKCLEYVEEDKEQFKQLAESLKVTATLVSTGPYFPEDKESRNIYRVFISRNGKNISFRFGDSVANTLEGNEPDLYSILASIGAEYDLNGIEDFNQFCDEYGYDQDSRKAEKIFKDWKAHNEKLRKIFSDDDIMVLPH